MDSDLVAALRSRGVTVTTPLDAGLIEKSDEEQLVFAAEHGCVLYTFNVSDFYRLHTLWAGGARLPSDATFYLIVEEAVRRANRREFASVARLPGSCASLAGAILEFCSAGPFATASRLIRQ